MAGTTSLTTPKSEVDQFLDSYKPSGAGMAAKPNSEVDELMKSAPPQGGGFLSDVGKSLKSGVEQLPGIVTGILDLPSAIATGARPFSKAADEIGEATGFRPSQWAKATQYSQGYQQGQQAIDQAWKDGSAGDIALSYLKNPGYTANQVVQSVPSMLLGGVASKAALGVGRVAGIAGDAAEGIAARAAVPGALERAVGEKLAVPVAAGAGEGAVTAGQQMDQYEGPDQQKNAIASLGAGAITGAIGVGAGRLAHSLGLETAETAIAKAGTGAEHAAADVPMSMKRRILGGIVTEGVLQELPQSAQEQMWQNYADGKPIMDGVVRQGIEGALAGGVMGGVANVRGEGAAHGAPPAADPPVDAQTAEQAAEPAPEARARAARRPGATAADTIIVDPAGTATTAAQQGGAAAADAPAETPVDVAPADAAAPADVPAAPEATPTESAAQEPPKQRPSEAMGLDASAGPLSAAAVTAVDSGAHQSLKDATAQAQAADSTAMLQSQGTGSKEAVTAPDGSSAPQADQAGLDPTVFPTYEQADAFRKEQMARGGSISALPVPADGGFRLATKGSAGYSEGELLRQDRMAQQQRADAGILDGDILKKSGEPFSNRVQARNAVSKAGPGHEIAPVKGGFVVRPVSQDLAAQAQATVQSVAEKSAVSAAQAPAQAVAAAPAIPQPNAVQQALANIREQKTHQQDQTHVADTAAPAEAGQVPAAAPQAQTDQAGNAADGRPSVSAEGVSAAGSAAVEGNGVAAPAAQAPEFTKTKDIGGHSVTVRTADLQSDKPKLRMFTQDGKPRAGSIHRDNLDPTGEKLAANAAENAANPLFNTITNKSGGAFATAPAAQRQLNRMGLGATHEVLPAGNGFVVRKKVQTAPAVAVEQPDQPAAAQAEAFKNVPASKVETPAQGVLNNATAQKDQAFQRLKDVRQQVKDGTANRLQLIKAEAAHKDALREVEAARNQVERDANRQGLTTLKAPAMQTADAPTSETSPPVSQQKKLARGIAGKAQAARQVRESAAATAELTPTAFSRSPMKSVEANVSRGRESLSRALADRTSVHRAMFRNGLGWVDFVWGAPGRVTPSGKTRGAMGLAHIAEARRRKDRMSEAEIARTLDGIVNAIARGTETRRHTQGSTVQVALEKDGIEAILTRRAGSNAWLLTGYETKSPGVSEAGNVALTTTADGSTTTRPAVVAGDSASIARPAPESKSASSDAALSVEKGPVRKISTQDSNEQLIATQALVDELKANWSRAPDVVVARNMDDPHIPDDVRALDQQMRDQGGDGSVKGFLARGTVYLLSDNLSSPQQIAETLFHEALGHYGLRRAFGASLKPILQQIVTMRRTQVIDKARAYGLFDKDQLQGLTAKTASDFHIWSAMSPEQRLTAAEEVLAEMAETSPTIGFVSRAIAAIRTWLRETIPALKNLDLTDAEIIRSYITPAREFVTRQNESVSAAVGRAMGTVFPGVAFQRGAGDQIETPEFKRWFGESKVVDAAGKPLVVYHATVADFNAFDRKAESIFGYGENPDAGGIFFDADPKVVDYYVDPKSKGARVIPAYLQIENPAILPANMALDKQAAALRKAQTDGHDGAILGGMEYVVFKPEQIKSATGNNGQFDPGNPDIRFSRTTTAGVAARMGDAIKSVNVQNIKDKAGYKKTDWLGLGLQTLGRRQIVEIYGKDLPQLNEYNKLAAQMEADKNEVGTEADQLAQRWGKLKDEKQLADLMHDATLAQIDAAEPYVAGDDQAQHMILSRRFQALTNEAKQVYLDARNAYEDHHSKVREAIKQRIMRSELTGPRRAELLKRMDDEFFKKTKGVYFPLARFGQYVVSVRGPNGAIASVNRAETMAEAQALHASLSKAYPAKSGFEVVRPVLSKEFIASRDAVGRGFMTNLFSALENVDMGANERMELEDTLGQLYLSSLPDLSWAKHGIHRKGTPGFSQDARRAFAQNMFHGGRYLAKLRYADRMQSAITDMQKTADDLKEVEDFDQPTAQRVIDEMQKRHEALMNPKSNSLSSSITSFGFVFFLGMSPASALVNLSQTALVAYPVMAAKWGFDKSGAVLLRASKEAAKGKNDITGFLTPEERGAYDEAVRAGTIDVTQAHDLASIAQGEDSGVMWKIRPVMRWASFMFHHAERFNRQVTFIAAYRLAREAGADKASAYEQATDATYKGHFDYSSGNRPRVMQGNTAKVLLLFKQFGQNMIYTMARNAQQSINGETPEARREARRALAGLLVMHGLGAGTLGLPMVTTLLAAASMLGGGGGDEPWDAKVALQNLLADTFGQKAAEVLMHGVSRLTPWDISGRVGLDSLILPDVQEGLEGQRLAESAMAGALGPAAGIGINVLKGLQDMSNGEYARGLEGMMPAVLRNVMKSVRYAKEGAQDKSGVVIKDEVSPAGVIGQALGFSPSDVRNASEGRSAVIALDSALNRRRSQLLNEFANAQRKGDPEDVSAARADIAHFNEKNPDRRITVPQMMQSVRARQRRIDQAKDGVYLPKSHRDAAQAGRFAVTG